MSAYRELCCAYGDSEQFTNIFERLDLVTTIWYMKAVNNVVKVRQ